VWEECISTAVNQARKDLKAAEYNLKTASEEEWSQCLDKNLNCTKILSCLLKEELAQNYQPRSGPPGEHLPAARGARVSGDFPAWVECHNCKKEGPWRILCPSCSVEHIKQSFKY
jgi:hypothetical protein